MREPRGLDKNCQIMHTNIEQWRRRDQSEWCSVYPQSKSLKHKRVHVDAGCTQRDKASPKSRGIDSTCLCVPRRREKKNKLRITREKK